MKTELGLAAHRLPSTLLGAGWPCRGGNRKMTRGGRPSIGWPAESSKSLLGSAATGMSVSVERRAMLLAGVLGGRRTSFSQGTSALHETPWVLV